MERTDAMSPLALLAASVPWLITEAGYRTVLEVANRENLDLPTALQRQAGRQMDGTARVTRRATALGDVALVPVAGPLFRYANLFTEVSGATSVEMLAQDFAAALDDPTVAGIVLNIDSPGGQVNGIAEFAQHVRAARDIKPVVAYVGDAGASGAYWIASAAERIVIAPTAQVGSIGVVQVALDTTARDAQRGVSAIKIISSQSPNKQPDARTEAGRSILQASIDQLASVFIETVATNRGVSVETVMNDFGRGHVLIGQAAVDAGMADAVGSLESVLAEIAAARPTSSPVIRPAAASAVTAEKDPSDMTTATQAAVAAALASMTADQLRAQAPTLVGAIEASAVTAQRPEIERAAVEAARPAIAQAAAQAERDRILGIEAAALPGHTELVQKFKADGVTTPGQAAIQIAQAERSRRAAQVGSLATDDALVSGVRPAPTLPGSAEGAGPSSGAGAAVAGGDVEARCKAVWERDPAIRAEFGSLATFVAYETANASGVVSIHGAHTTVSTPPKASAL